MLLDETIRIIQKAREVIFDKSGVTVRLPKVNTEYEWSFYNEGLEGPHHFLLVSGKESFLTIPKRVFQSGKDADIFRDILKNHLPVFKQKLKIPFDF